MLRVPNRDAARVLRDRTNHGSPARLNLGDCASYALARSRGLPLLFKGNHFVHTDIEPVARFA